MWRVSGALNKRGSKYFRNCSYIFTCVSSVKGAELVAKPPFVEKSSLAWQKFKRCTGVLSHHSNKTELVTLQKKHQFSSLLSIYIFMNHQLREGLQTNILINPISHFQLFFPHLSYNTKSFYGEFSCLTARAWGPSTISILVWYTAAVKHIQLIPPSLKCLFTNSVVTPWVHTPRARSLFRVMWKSPKTKVAISVLFWGSPEHFPMCPAVFRKDSFCSNFQFSSLFLLDKFVTFVFFISTNSIVFCIWYGWDGVNFLQ